MKSKKKYPPTYLYLAISVMVVLHFLLPITQLFYGCWKLIGIIPLLVSVYINFATVRANKTNDTTVKPDKESIILLTDGIFSISRNPMYLGKVLILIL